jgi:arylsulfatase A-like enzyme
MTEQPIDRRRFMGGLAGAGAAGIAAKLLAQARDNGAAGAPAARPNILWIVSEDNNPYLGCYGDKLARTPTIDQLAKEGVLYENCFSQSPVCAPSRFTLITGMYATSCGPANHMRAEGKPPAELRGFPAYLRDVGYYCTNHDKTDYNAPVDMKDTWDDSSKNAHWRNRPAGKPFFAVFNFEVTHESSIFGKYQPLADGTDPASVRIPAYCPDTPETRADRALYYDQHRRLDVEVAELLAQLKGDGLAEDTIVFYYGDNGGVLPRSKRFAYESGLHVPLIIRFPEKWRRLAPGPPGSRVESPVSFVDFAPTMLSLAGATPPKYYQGHAFAGPKKEAPQEYAFCHRDRMDERYDLVRTARDKQFRYIRNYRPDLPWGMHVQYLWEQAGMKVWEKLYKAGKLNEVQRRFWEEKPEEELYDLHADPDEVNNLTATPEHRATLDRLRAALRKHMLEIRDNGFIPEGSPLEGFANTRDESTYPLERVLAAADLATARDAANLSQFIKGMAARNEVIRYWSVLGCLMLKEKAEPAKEALLKAMQDSSPQVQVVAAETLCRIGETERGLKALGQLLLKHENAKVRLQAANSLDHLGPIAKPAWAPLRMAAKDKDDYVKRATRYTAAILTGEEPPREGE